MSLSDTTEIIDYSGSKRKRTANDYQFGNSIGEGSYSKVYSAVDKHTKRTYAIKVLSKTHIVKENKTKYVNIEKTTLHRLGQQHPGIVQLYYTFQDSANLFFVLDLAEYGELLSIIRKFGSLSEGVSKFYMCQLLDAVKFIHSKGVIHRDLKPENILVGYDFNLKITDFGAAKLLGPENEDSGEKIDYSNIGSLQSVVDRSRQGSFVGTAEYVAPELLKYNSCGFESDVWAIGCILYQFFHGNPPFKGSTEYLTFEKIINVDYAYNQKYPIPKPVSDLIDSILVADITQRYTIAQIMSSPWFSEVPWNNSSYIWKRNVPVFEPYSFKKPDLKSSNSTPYLPVYKNGSSRDLNKSHSYQQLHAQIQNSDFSLVPSFQTKNFRPVTKLKKNIITPPNSQNSDLKIADPMLGSISNMKFNISASNGMAPLPSRQQPNIIHPRNTQHIQSPQVQPPKIFQSSATSNDRSPESVFNSSYTNVRTNTAFAAMPSKQKNVTTNTRNTYSQGFSNPVMVQTNSFAAVQGAKTAADSKHRSNTTIELPPAQQMTTTSIVSSVSPDPNKAKGSTILKAKTTSTIKGKSREYDDVSKPNADSKPKQPDPSNIIRLSEISALLEKDEKILKLDHLYKSVLKNSVLKRKDNQPLHDSYIETVVHKYEDLLDSEQQNVVAAVTSTARLIFIDSSLDVMIVDLKSNQGADYLMYDLEFEDPEDSSPAHSEYYGYLILELVKQNGDLIFLKKVDGASNTYHIPVVTDRNNTQVKIGLNQGWIDCLMVAKQNVDNEISKGASEQKTKAQVVKEAKKNIQKTKNNSSNISTNNPNSSNIKSSGAVKTTAKKSNVSNFAYAAAAAAGQR